MAKKEDIFGKLNMKDYNNQLEEILEKKNFSSDTKNFLLSMLYKVETAYNDYYIVKNIEKTKSEFIEEIIETIQNDCEEIELIKPLDKEYAEYEQNKEKCIVNKKEKKIISVSNEQNLLYAIFKLRNRQYKFKNNIIKKPLEELLTAGENINAKEVIRDFDGWAWHIETKLIENIEYNLIYQNILLLIGDNLRTEHEIKQKLGQIYNKENAKKVYILICKIALLMYLSNHNEELANYNLQMKEIKQKLDAMENKVEYLKDITSKRKKLEARIKNIDKSLMDVALLKKEYIKTNEKLDDDKKIFSISDFVETIQKEKNELICEFQKYNAKMKPENYLKEKEELKENLKILKVLDSKKQVYDYIFDLQKEFIVGMQEQINKVQTRKDVMSIIYKLRYYKFIPYKDKQIKNVKEIQESIYQTEEMIYNVACKMNVLTVISINNQVNNEVISNILDTAIVELENIELLFKAENYQIILRIFDEENMEKTIEYDTIEGLTARMNKRFRLFIK